MLVPNGITRSTTNPITVNEIDQWRITIASPNKPALSRGFAMGRTRDIPGSAP